jgi:hypothetical protein
MVKVEYDYDKFEIVHSSVSFDLSPTTSFTFEEFDTISSEMLEDLRNCMTSGERSITIWGGGNSCWDIFVKNKTLNLCINVGGSGEGCSLNSLIVCDEHIMSEFDKLIEVRKSMNIRLDIESGIQK